MNIKKKAPAITPTLPPEGVAELRRLLDGCALTAGEGIARRGRGVEVVVSVWDSEGKADCFDAHFTAFGPGGERVRLDGVAAYARGQDEEGGLLHPGRLMRRGDLTIQGMRKGVAYELRLPAVMGRSQQPVPLAVRPPRVKSAESAGPTADTSSGKSAEYTSTDGQVVVTVREGHGAAVVAFETREARLAGAAVRFALVQESGRVEHSGEVRLERVEEGVWEKRWTGSVYLSAPCELVFEVLPEGQGGMA
jgi:hypothetical protein